MSIDDEFIATIRANPDDDTPRLIYADWLDEQGDPRGEFIRVQCALATMSKDDPRRWDLELRQTRLLRWHGWQWWYEPFEPRSQRPTFHRGFAQSVAIDTENFLKHHALIFQHYPLLEELTFLGISPWQVAGLLAVALPVNVKCVRLDTIYRLGREDLEHLERHFGPLWNARPEPMAN